MGLYDTLDAADKALADAKADKHKIDKDIAAVMVKAGDEADEVVIGAIGAAKADGVAVGTKAAGGADKTKTEARVVEINTAIGSLQEQHKQATDLNRYTVAIGITRQISALKNELNALQQAEG